MFERIIKLIEDDDITLCSLWPADYEQYDAFVFPMKDARQCLFITKETHHKYLRNSNFTCITTLCPVGYVRINFDICGLDELARLPRTLKKMHYIGK